MIEKIVSGGQTGVDQAALLIASELHIPMGGWCPKGGLDEEGFCILERYPSLREAITVDPDERTQLNIRDSDGTLIIVPDIPLPEKIKDGTRLTIINSEQQEKPNLIVSLSQREAALEHICEWINRENIYTLNIAGPRESSSPGIYCLTCDLLRKLFAKLQSEKMLEFRLKN